MSERANHTDLRRGEHAFRELDELSLFALVGEGKLRVYRAGSGGREITLYRVGPGELCLVNILSVLLSKPAVASAVAEERTEMAVLPAEDLQLLLDSSTAFRTYLFGTMLKNLVDVLQLVREVALETVTKRVVNHLLRRATLTEEGPAVHTTHEEIAAKLGTAREVVSRVLKHLENNGSVSLARDRVSILDLEKLRRLNEIA